MRVVNGIEIFGDIGIHHPAQSILHEAIAQSAKRLHGAIFPAGSHTSTAETPPRKLVPAA